MTVTIYHNPACGTSRRVLEMIRARGIEPVVIEYLKTPPDRDRLQALLGAMGLTPRQLLRTKGTLATELGLDRPDCGDDAVLDAMVTHPALIERPIVVAPKGTRLCRPAERVADLLD
jgi:arsenate reductase